jgi:class 3 adenylate cyclase
MGARLWMGRQARGISAVAGHSVHRACDNPWVPSGTASRTLTFLFADIRNYTGFVEDHGDARARQLIATFRRLVRAQLGVTGGGEIKTEGDSFYLVFQTAGQALRCAIAIMNEAANDQRPGGALPVGIGIHAGEPVPLEGQYVGSAVNIAARLGAVAGTGELLISETVRGLLRTSDLPPVVEREGLQLKGVRDAPRAYAVDWHTAEFMSAGEPAVRWIAGLRTRRVFIAAVLGAIAIAVVSVVAVTRGPATAQLPGATEALPSHGIRLYEADLTPLGSSRVLVSTGSALSDHVVFAGDAIRFEVSAASWAALSVSNLSPDDFVAEFAVRRISGQGSVALFFRGSAGRQDQVVVVPATGELAIQVVRSFDIDAAPERLFGPATRIPSGRDDITLGVSARGQQLTVFLRGAEVARATDPVAASGGVGVVANAARGQVLVIELRALHIYNP